MFRHLVLLVCIWELERWDPRATQEQIQGADQAETDGGDLAEWEHFLRCGAGGRIQDWSVPG